MRVCNLAGCGKKHEARGWCNQHYLRWKKYGDPTRTSQLSVEDRFFQKVDAGGDCWEWTGYRVKGYGMFSTESGQTGAHRWIWEHLVGPIPERYDIDHLCRNPGCVNPDHLEPVTRAENTRRGVWADTIRRKALAQTHCVNGHEYTSDNTYVDSKGHRYCRSCRSDNSRAYYQRQKGA